MEGLLQALSSASKDGGHSNALPPGLAGFMGSAGSGLDLKALSAQAANLWKHLDDLAENDTEAYQAFLAKQAKGMEEERAAAGGGARSTAATAPVLVLEAAVTAPVGPKTPMLAVLHLWPAVDGRLKPATCSSSTAAAQPITSTTTVSLDNFCLPLAQLSAPTTQTPESGGGAVHHHILCNAETLRLAVCGTPPQLRPLLVEAACQFVESSHCITLGRSARQLKVNSTALGADQQIHQPIQAADELQAAVAGTSAENLSMELLSQLSNFSSDRSNVVNAARGARGNADGVQAPAAQMGCPAAGRSSGSAKVATPARQPLIQEMTTSVISPHDVSKESVEVHSCTTARTSPAATVPTSDRNTIGSAEVSLVSTDKGRHLRIIAHLPGVSRASAVEIECAGLELMLITTDGCLKVVLPSRVDEGASVAKFDAKSRVLTLTLPCVPA